MQFTSGLITLFLAASGVQALPGSIESRQSGLITAEYFADTGCDTAVLETDSYGVAGDEGICFAAGVPNAQSLLITNNDATLTLRFYATADCSDTGNWFDVLPGITDCFALKVQSVKYL